MELYKCAPGQLIFQGHNLTRALAIASARKHLVESKDISEFEADDMLADVPNRTVQAWWNDLAGIVQSDFPDAEPITVVNICADERVFGPREPVRRSRPVALMEIL